MSASLLAGALADYDGKHTDVLEAVRRLVEALPRVEDVWARLHVCQTVRSLAVPASAAAKLAAFLEECRASDRPFLRAWATDGLHNLGAAHDAFAPTAAAALDAAQGDPAASVRARARRIRDGRC